MGASLRETGSHPSDQAPSGLGASRFDPARIAQLRHDFEMTERVAKAIFLAEHPGAEWNGGRARSIWFTRAWAAIGALREPTPDMLAAGGRLSAMKDPVLRNLNAGAIWRAMVKAADFPRDSD